MTQRPQWGTTGGKCCQKVGSKHPNWCKISPRINRKLALACPCGTPLRPSAPWLEAFVFQGHPSHVPLLLSMISQDPLQGVSFRLSTSANILLWRLNIGNLESGPVLLTLLTANLHPDSSASLVERFPLKLLNLTSFFFGFCKHVLHSTNVTCSFFSWEQFLSTSGLRDPDADWLLNTLLCMFYECDDYGASTSEPVVCHWSRRMCPLSRSYLSVTLSRLKLFSFSPLIWSCATWRGRRLSLHRDATSHLHFALYMISLCHVSAGCFRAGDARNHGPGAESMQFSFIYNAAVTLQVLYRSPRASNSGKKNSFQQGETHSRTSVCSVMWSVAQIRKWREFRPGTTTPMSSQTGKNMDSRKHLQMHYWDIFWQAATPPGTAAAPPWTGSHHARWLRLPSMSAMEESHILSCKKEREKIKTETCQPWFCSILSQHD